MSEKGLCNTLAKGYRFSIMMKFNLVELYTKEFQLLFLLFF